MSKKLLSVINLDFNTVIQQQINSKRVIYNKGAIIKHNEEKVVKKAQEELNNNNRIKTAKPLLKKPMSDIDIAILQHKDVIDTDDESKYIGNILGNAGVFSKKEIEETAIEIQKERLKLLKKEKDIKVPLYMNKSRPKTANVTSRLYQPKKIYYDSDKDNPKNKTKSKSRSKSKPKQYNHINPFDEEAEFIPSQADNNIINTMQKPPIISQPLKEITEKEISQTIKRYQVINDAEKKILTLVNKGILSKSITNTFNKAPKNEIIQLNVEANEALNKKANEDMIRTETACNDLIKRTKDIDFKIKNEMKELKQIPLKKQFDEAKGLMVIEGVKEDIKTAPSFDVNNLNEKDKKLMTSKLNYHPKKRQQINNLRHTDEKYANFLMKNDDLLNRSLETIKHLQSKRTKAKKQINKSKILNQRGTILQSKKEINEYIGAAYANLYNKGKQLSIKEIKHELNKDIDTKEDLYDYFYLKEKESQICYYHPFLADGGML